MSYVPKQDVTIREENGWFRVKIHNMKGLNVIHNQLKLVPGGKLVAFAPTDAQALSDYLHKQGLNVSIQRQHD